MKSEADSSDERDGDKLAAFTVLLHGSLKVEQMVALVQIGFAHFSVCLLLVLNGFCYTDRSVYIFVNTVYVGKK